MKSLPPKMTFSTDCTELVYDLPRWVLRGHMIDIIETLRFPAVHLFLHSQTTTLINEMSPTTLRLAREYLENAVHRIEANLEGFLHRHQGTWLMVRSCTRSALILLAAALKCRGEVEAGRSPWGGAGMDAIGDLSARNGFNPTGDASTGIARAILPENWGLAVVQVLNMLGVWKAECPDVERLHLIVGTLWRVFEHD